MLQVLLLGSPEIHYNGELIPIKRKLARHLLVYLACAPGKVGRAELTSLFWSEEPDTVANTRLRDTLRHLKEQLPEKDLIVKYVSQLATDNVKVYVDVKDFDHKLISIRRSLQFWSHNKPVPAGTLVVMQEALQLWRTPHFLHGINLPAEGDYANWVIRTGQRLEMDRQYLLSQLVDHALVNGSSAQALEWLQQALQTDELHPDLNLRYIETLMELDRLPEALSQIRYLRKQYHQQDYGEFPPALDRLYQKLRHPAARQVEGESELADSVIMETPYVGQPTLLDEMNRLFVLRNGAIIRGEAGSGKTRLLHELSKSISPLPRFIQINPKAAEKDLAYHAIAVMLSQGITDTEWHALNPSFASELLLLVPELAGKFPQH